MFNVSEQFTAREVIKKLRERMDLVNIDIVNAEEQIKDTEEICRKSRMELDAWFEIRFFKEDSERLKEVHGYITKWKEKDDMYCRETGSIRNQVPLRDELTPGNDANRGQHGLPCSCNFTHQPHQ